MKYAKINENGFIVAFFDTKINKNIPKDAIKIAEEFWKKHISGQKQVYKDGEWIDYVEPESVVFERRKKGLYNAIQNLADTKTKELKNYIAGKRVTPEQVDRYEQKYQLALKCKEAGDYIPLNLEAELQGITGEELADLIIQKHDEWVAELQKYTALIEAYRVKAQTIVESLETIEDIEKAKELLEKAKEFGIDTTEEQIKELFEEFEGGA